MPDCLFRFITNGTCIKKNYVSLIYIGGCIETTFLKNRSNDFTVREIHLTAVTFNIEFADASRIVVF